MKNLIWFGTPEGRRFYQITYLRLLMKRPSHRDAAYQPASWYPYRRRFADQYFIRGAGRLAYLYERTAGHCTVDIGLKSIGQFVEFDRAAADYIEVPGLKIAADSLPDL